MDIIELQGMDLISLEWNEARFNLRAINSAGEVFEAALSNPGQAPIGVKVHWLNLRMIYDQDAGMYSLGELETIALDNSAIHIEADAGFFSITAAKIFVQQVAGLTGNEA
jgi:hypothetical protein